MSVRIVAFEFFFDQVIEVREDRIVFRSHAAEVASLRDSPFRIELGHHNLNGVDVGIAEILIGSEEVLEKGNMLCQQSAFCGRLPALPYRPGHRHHPSISAPVH